MTHRTNHEYATLGAGCFWCSEAVFKKVKGVISVESGYSGGFVKNPSYREVCTGSTGHAEVIQIQFDPTQINYKDILKIFFSIHDPTTLNRQGADIGTQYRSVIFYHNMDQKKWAEEFINDINMQHVFSKPVVTEVKEFTAFYKAEEYHHDYFNRNPEVPYCSVVIKPKLEKFVKNNAGLVK